MCLCLIERLGVLSFGFPKLVAFLTCPNDLARASASYEYVSSNSVAPEQTKTDDGVVEGISLGYVYECV